jgi:peptidoglycan/LPS O-acetylase OafA/YrhL
MTDAPNSVGIAGSRIASLDGMRGLMAAIVVLWHAFLILVPLVETWVAAAGTRAVHRFDALLSLDLLTQAIVVFFLLSGFVVAMPMMRSGRSWRRYYSSRLLRLYLPAWGSIALSAVLILAVPRTGQPAGIWLSDTNATSVTLSDVLWDASLMTQRPMLNNPLWSLTWEVLFSLLLPLYVLIARSTRRHWVWAMLAAVILSAVGFEFRIYAVAYLASFLVGTIAAANTDGIAAGIQRIRRARLHAGCWWLIFLVSLFSVLGYRVTQSLQLQKPFTLINHILASTTIVGYAGFLLIAIGSVTASRFLATRVVQWGGRISFSLYLVHVPVLATLAFAMPDMLPVAILIGVPASFAVAAAFSRFVERPAHRFAHWVGRRASRSVVTGPISDSGTSG